MTTTLTKFDLKTAILRNLPIGHEHTITGDELVDIIGINYNGWYVPPINNRALRLTIRALLDDGYPICSSPGRKADPKTNTPKQEAGYFMAENPHEVEQALRVLKYGYGYEIFKHYRALLKAGQKAFPQQIDVPHGQLKLDLFKD